MTAFKPREPIGQERRHIKRFRQITKAIQDEIVASMQSLLAIWPNVRADAADDVNVLRSVLTSVLARGAPEPVELTVGSIRHQFRWIREQLNRAFADTDFVAALTQHLSLSARDMDSFSVTELGRALGVDIKRDIPEIAELLEEWTSSNVKLIKAVATTPGDGFSKPLVDDLSDYIVDMHENGMSLRELTEGIKERLEIGDRRAAFIAKDQILKLNGKITETRQKLAGISSYTWSTSRDVRVRPSHQALEGTPHLWSEPPAVGHPGQDYQCRCVAVPVKPSWLDAEE